MRAPLFALVVLVAAPLFAQAADVRAAVMTDATNPAAQNSSITVPFQTERLPGIFVAHSPRAARIGPGETLKIEVWVQRVQFQNESDTIPAGTIVEAHFSLGSGATIEAIGPVDWIEPTATWNCSIAGATATCSAIARGGDCCGYLAVTVRAGEDRAGGRFRLDSESTVQRPGFDLPYAADTDIEVFRQFVVTNVQDAGAGSLRAEITDANTQCGSLPCRILFEIPPPVPAEGWFTITPESPLPPIVAERFVIDAGLSQTAKTGDTNPNGPEVVLDGHLAGEGMEVHAPCEATVRGLSFRNFTTNQGLWLNNAGPCESSSAIDRLFNIIRFEIAGNHFEANLRGLRLDDSPIWVDVTSNVIRNNRYSGIWMWRGAALIVNNFIVDNGASGIFLGPEVRSTRVIANVIRGHPHMGVAVAYGASLVDINSNSMQNNRGLGIDWGLDGVTPPQENDAGSHTNAPILLAATYDSATNRTNVTVAVRTTMLVGPIITFVAVQLFANEGPDGDGEQQITWVHAQSTDGAPFTVSLHGDFRGKWINATATRAVSLFAKPPDVTANVINWGDFTSTSELSNAVLVVP